MSIIIASLTLIFLFLINKLVPKLIFKVFARKIAIHSVGYITKITYERFNFFNLTFYGLEIKTRGSSISSLKVPFIKFKIQYKILFLIISDSILIRGSDYIKLAKFTPAPSFIIRIDRIFNIQLKENVTINLFKEEQIQVIDRQIIVQSFKFDSYSRDEARTDLDLKFSYIKNKINNFIFHFNCLIFLGTSKRTKRNFIKGIQVSNFKLAGYRSKITGSGKIEYKYEDNPIGYCDISIQNPKYIMPDFLKDQSHDVKTSVDDFIGYMLNKKNDKKSSNLKLKLLYQKDSVTINSENLSDIRKNLNT